MKLSLPQGPVVAHAVGLTTIQDNKCTDMVLVNQCIGLIDGSISTKDRHFDTLYVRIDVKLQSLRYLSNKQ